MREYVGTKTINAKPMNKKEYCELRGWEVPADEDPNEAGYLVEYLDSPNKNHPQFDNYISWSPATVFEKAYRLTQSTPEPVELMTFGDAIEALKRGAKVSRKGWNGNKLPPVVSPYPTHIPKERLEIVGDYAYLLGSKGSVAVFDAERVDRLNGRDRFSENTGGYLCVAVNNVTTNLHSILFDCPSGYCIDHINGDVLDNREENIRIVTNKQNLMNSKGRKNSTSKYKGVSWDSSRSKWIASFTFNKYTNNIGRFDSEEAAAAAYDDAAYQVHGEYARLNLPDRKQAPRMYLWLKPAAVIKSEECKDSVLKEICGSNNGEVLADGTICLSYVTETGRRAVLTGWSASQSDMLLEDWFVVDENARAPRIV